MKQKLLYLYLLSVIISCSTLKLIEYETSFKVLENPANYISIDNIKAFSDHIEITFTNNSNDVVSITWPKTTLNLSLVVTRKPDIELIDKPSVYKKKYQEFFVGPNTSETLSIYPLDNVYKYKKIDKIKNSETYFYEMYKIKYPEYFNFSIIKANIKTKKTLNILISRTPKTNKL